MVNLDKLRACALSSIILRFFPPLSRRVEHVLVQAVGASLIGGSSKEHSDGERNEG